MDEITFARWCDQAEDIARGMEGKYNFVTLAAPTMTPTQASMAQQELNRRLGDQTTKVLVARSATLTVTPSTS